MNILLQVPTFPQMFYKGTSNYSAMGVLAYSPESFVGRDAKAGKAGQVKVETFDPVEIVDLLF